jgi:hypothetical protein
LKKKSLSFFYLLLALLHDARREEQELVKVELDDSAVALHQVLRHEDALGAGNGSGENEKLGKRETKGIFHQVVVQRGDRGQRHLQVGDGEGSEHLVDVQSSRTIAVCSKETLLAQSKKLVQRRVLVELNRVVSVLVKDANELSRSLKP